MLVDLGPAVYVDDFEAPFIAASSEFYKKEAAEYLAGSSCPDYLVKAEKRLGEERERVKKYLDPSTEAKITKAVETELILNQVSAGGGRLYPFFCGVVRMGQISTARWLLSWHGC